jgi:hypothetical protein
MLRPRYVCPDFRHVTGHYTRLLAVHGVHPKKRRRTFAFLLESPEEA